MRNKVLKGFKEFYKINIEYPGALNINNFRQKFKNYAQAITNNKKEIATILNEQFASVFVDEPADETLPDLPSRTKSNLNDLDINTSDITHLLTKLDKYKS